MKKTLIILLLFSLAACDERESYTVLYNNDGSIKKITHFKNKLIDGSVMEFYPDGKMKFAESWSKNHKNGPSFYYFENGQTAHIMYYKNGLENGLNRGYYPEGNVKFSKYCFNNKNLGNYYEYYSKTDGGGLKIKINTSIVDNREIRNGYVSYDKAGHIKECFLWPGITINKKVFKLKDSVIVTVRILCPRKNKIIGFLYKDISNYPCIHDSEIGTEFDGKNHAVRFGVRANKIGWNFLQGYVTDYSIKREVFSPVYGKGFEMIEKRVYFNAKYLVK